MKVAYIFSTQGHTVSYKLGRMILPQLEAGRHGADVVGMFFFEDNVTRCGKATRWASAWRRWPDQCCYERGIASDLIEGVAVGCFPDLYAALAGNMPDQVTTL